MPGYVLHLTEAELLIQQFKQHGYELDEQWVNAFRLGHLLPDTKRKIEKTSSHFWNPEEVVKWAIPPQMNRFENKYQHLFNLSHPTELGYLFHLLLDTAFVNEFWPASWEFLDANNVVAELQSEVTQVYIKHKNTYIPIKQFFSGECYYGDYSRLNQYYIQKYQVQIPQYIPTLNCNIEEVHMTDLHNVLDELTQLQESSNDVASQNLSVFEHNHLESFIKNHANIAYQYVKNRYLS